MYKIIVAVPVALLLILPFAASAHQHASFDIGGTQYDFVIGSLNEPVVVDDKTGLDLRVTSGGRMQKAEDGDMEPVGGKPATGLESDLKVEMIAGESKKTFDISPVYNAPGSYSTTFFPTLATTFSYRVFGTINNTPVNLTFTCRAEGEESADEGEKQISEGVKQIMKGGGFGCPSPKEELGFPEQSSSVHDLATNSSKSSPVALGALVIALGALAVSFTRRQ